MGHSVQEQDARGRSGSGMDTFHEYVKVTGWLSETRMRGGQRTVGSMGTEVRGQTGCGVKDGSVMG